MWELFKQLGALGSWIPIIVVFIALPYLYISLAADVHNEYAELVKFAISSPTYSSTDNDALMEEISNRIHIFELEWWVIAAAGVVLVAILHLGELARISSVSAKCPVEAMTRAEVTDSSTERMRPVVAEAAAAAAELKDCQAVQSLLSLYGAVIGLFFAFRIAWGRVVAARELRRFYAKLGMSNRPATQASNGRCSRSSAETNSGA